MHQHLHPQLHALLSRFHVLNGRPLRAVWHVYAEECLDKIILDFEEDSLAVESEPEDDTIIFDVTSHRDRNTDGWIDATYGEFWNNFIGEPFGWGWITINQQDALDGIMLSFRGIRPQLLLNVIASSIKETIISQPSTK